MEYFLQRIAKEILAGNKNRMNDQCLVFPNRRAGLFFAKYLADEISEPVWMPSVMTINDIFHSLSILKPAENELLLLELFKVYRRLTAREQSFDDFYYWGDMLLNDFDDIDKYLVDASKLFRNVKDLRSIDEQFGALEPEQVEIIKQFWINFNPEKPSDEKSKFLTVWSILAELYREFKSVLKIKNIAYEGMISRDVVDSESWKNSVGFKWETVHFIGFNALNECEKALMSALKEKGRARFYWDFDNSYIRAGELNSAGFFLRKNISQFGNDMPSDWNYNTMLSDIQGRAVRRVIETSSDVAQVKLLPALLKQIPGLIEDNPHQTAVVLADENLLVPVITSIPDDVRDVNITMGYPLRETSVYILIRTLFDLQRNSRVSSGFAYFAYRDVIRILKNKLISELLEGKGEEILKKINEGNILSVPLSLFENHEILSEIFSIPSTPHLLADYLKSALLLIAGKDDQDEKEGVTTGKKLEKEFIYRIILSINRLDMISSDPGITLSAETWMKLLDRILRIQSVPFSGEPLSGIQIMGILETRALDFKNLIILSVNEGVMPSVTTASSFIPFSLREAFGLPSINHQESIYAYHFYRLLHRAENVTILFNSNSEGLRSGEMSRFLQQMKYQPLLKPEYLNLAMEIRNPVSPPSQIDRTEEMSIRLLSGFTDKGKKKILSPSSINTWLNCRMKFYYRYVNNLREPEKISEEIDPALLGTMLHEIMKNLYHEFIGREVGPEQIVELRRNQEHLSEMIMSLIRKSFRNEDSSYVIINELIVKNVLLEYINRILETDKQTAPFTILSLEQQVSFRLIQETIGTEQEIMIGGIIDRVDLKNGVVRIVDYKTGVTSDSIRSVSDLFVEDRKKDSDCWLQTLIYCEGYFSLNNNAVVAPSVYKIKRVPGEGSTDKLIIRAAKGEGQIVEDFSQVREEFMENLVRIVGRIFSSKEPFFMTGDLWNKCSVCPYRRLCKR